MRGQIIECRGVRLKAQDDEIVALIESAKLHHIIGTCDAGRAVEEAIKCERLTLADLPVPIGLV